ncbi:MAG TPA: outer membrane lipoprotein-sorting protein, partial [Candidatus Aminicenantes bacterium]|nr:outer membrane lipoprotein-sorting protein [Candidatus Aminicenantes bacterium]
MSKKLFPFAVFIAVFLGAAFAPGQSEDPKVRELARKIDDLYRSDSSYARIEMEIVTPDWRRTLAL